MCLRYLMALLSISLAVAQAGSIIDRTQLTTLLGGPGTVEDFEGFAVANDSSGGLNCVVLNSASVCNGQGPGLVVNGVNFTFGSGGGQWDGAGYFGSTSKELLSGSPPGQPLVIDFTSPVSGFGVDLRAFSGYGATATLSIYAGNDTTPIGTLANIDLSSDGSLVFAGWWDPSGIGKVELTEVRQPWSPIIDNLEFGGGSGIPEPATVTLCIAGLAALGILRMRR